ncbi:sugar phosphate isomerase/epimerase family protein [candidate division KSB1 bacterium]
MGKKPQAITRRDFVKASAAGAAYLAAGPSKIGANPKGNPIRLGGPVFGKPDSPESWIKNVKKLGYSAAYCPLGTDADDSTVRAYSNAARKADIIIAEVGAWSNTISRDDSERREAIDKCAKGLDLADRIGANCCVNITGSRGEKWDGPHRDNLTPETFDLVVETVRAIVDAVKPTRTYYTLEPMPWTYPDSPDSYLRLIKAVERDRFAVHLDVVNIVNSPRRYYDTGGLIRECFAKLGPYIKSCHAKDIILRDNLTTHLDEIRPGLGGLDYIVYLKELVKYQDLPLMIEHLSSPEEYRLAAEHIRSVGGKTGLSFYSS